MRCGRPSRRFRCRSWTNRRDVRAARRRLVRRRFGRAPRRPRDRAAGAGRGRRRFPGSAALRARRAAASAARSDRPGLGRSRDRGRAGRARAHACRVGRMPLARRRAAAAGAPRSGRRAHAARARARNGRDADARVRDRLPSLGRLPHRLDPALGTRSASPPSLPRSSSSRPRRCGSTRRSRGCDGSPGRGRHAR